MNRKFIKYFLIMFIAGGSSTTLPVGFEITYDGEEVKVNGQNINDEKSSGYMLTKVLLPIVAVPLLHKIGKAENTPDGYFKSYVIGAALSSIATNTLYGKVVTRRKVFNKVGSVTGALIGNELGKYHSMIDPVAFCRHLGSAMVSQVCGDEEQSRIYLGKAVGEQLGMALLPPEQKEMAKVCGRNVGAALLSKENARAFYAKKAAVQPAVIYAFKKYDSRFSQLVQTARDRNLIPPSTVAAKSEQAFQMSCDKDSQKVTSLLFKYLGWNKK